MDKRVSSRAIIIDNGKLLTMFRRKKKSDEHIKEYYVIPGGGKEENETLEENVKRELNEEFNIDIEILGYLGSDEYDTTVDHFFAAKIVNGTPRLGGEELERMTEDNYYECRYIDINNLDSIDINSKDKIQCAIDKKHIDLK